MKKVAGKFGPRADRDARGESALTPDDAGAKNRRLGDEAPAARSVLDG